MNADKKVQKKQRLEGSVGHGISTQKNSAEKTEAWRKCWTWGFNAEKQCRKKARVRWSDIGVCIGIGIEKDTSIWQFAFGVA